MFDGCSSCGVGEGFGCASHDHCEAASECDEGYECVDQQCLLPCARQSDCGQHAVCWYWPDTEGRLRPYCASTLESTTFNSCNRAVGSECAAFTENSDGTCLEDGVKDDGGWCVLPDGLEAVCYQGRCSSCVPDCAGRACGDDGCGATCGVCDPGETCYADGRCGGCEPDCNGKNCGADGCGGSCGVCDLGATCGTDGWCGPEPCSHDTDCDSKCLDLTTCEVCACLDSRCVANDAYGCCEDDYDCDDGMACALDTHTCFDNFDGCPCDGQTYGGCTGGDQSCADLAVLLDPHYCVGHCGGLCCLADTDCGADHECRELTGEYLMGATPVTGPLLGTCVNVPNPPDCWLDSDCAEGETCAGFVTCPACHRAGEDGCTYAPGTCTPAP